tara:strand:- start:125 stop:409 length:285 start_codon:yes stop_codon:yes gene_type:complete
MGFREIKHAGETDSNVKNLDYDLMATNVAIDIKNNAIDVKYNKVYKDIEGNVFKTVPMSYRITDEGQIDAWDEAVGAMFETAIINQMKIRNGLS